MVDSKFLIVTTLCYVGIFFVVFIVCCCVWTRHLRKEGRGYSPRLRNNTNRRLLRAQPPPDYPVTTPSTPMYAQRGHEFAEVHFPDTNTYFPAAQREQNAMQRNNFFPMAGHYPMQPIMYGYPRGNLFPASVTTDVDITLDVNTFGGETGFSGENFSDATSSRFDGGDSSAFAENLEEKNHDQTPRTMSPSVESHDDKTEEAESDDSSRVCHLQVINL